MIVAHKFGLSKALPRSQVIFLAIAIGSSSCCALCQVAPPDEAQPGAMSTLDQATMYPVQSQLTQTPNQDSLNENASTNRYSDNALTRGPLFFSVETTGVATTNLYDSFDDQKAVGGGYLNVAVPLGVRLSTPITDFSSFFRVDSSFYPGHTDLNHTSEIYSHQLTHQLSDTTMTSWSLAGGHVVTVGHYFSPIIGIGTTGVVVPQEASGLQPLTDAATTYSISHRTSERDSLTAAATAGYIDQPAFAGSSQTGSYRQITGGGDLQWQHALNSREIAGIEVTNVYVEGLSPAGTSNFASVKLTFGQTLTPHSSITGGVGPLYVHSDFSGASTLNNLNYTANAAFQYKRTFGQISAGYARVYEVGYLAPTSVANEMYFSFDRPLSSRIFLSAATRYLLNSGQDLGTGYSTFGLSARLDMYVARNLAYHLEGSSLIQSTEGENPGYRTNEVSTGITYSFGNPFSRAGAQ